MCNADEGRRQADVSRETVGGDAAEKPLIPDAAAMREQAALATIARELLKHGGSGYAPLSLWLVCRESSNPRKVRVRPLVTGARERQFRTACFLAVLNLSEADVPADGQWRRWAIHAQRIGAVPGPPVEMQ